MCHYGEIWAVAIDSRQFMVTIKSSVHAYACIMHSCKINMEVSLRVWVNRDNTQNCSDSCRKCWDIFASTGTEDQERGFRGGFEQPFATWLAKVAGNGSWWCAAELERVAFGHRLYESSRAFRGFRVWFRMRSSFSEGAWIHRERLYRGHQTQTHCLGHVSFYFPIWLGNMLKFTSGLVFYLFVHFSIPGSMISLTSFDASFMCPISSLSFMCPISSLLSWPLSTKGNPLQAKISLIIYIYY